MSSLGPESPVLELEAALRARELSSVELLEACLGAVDARNGELDVEPFVSHRLTLDEVNRGFELMEAQDGIRSVISFA